MKPESLQDTCDGGFILQENNNFKIKPKINRNVLKHTQNVLRRGVNTFYRYYIIHHILGSGEDNFKIKFDGKFSLP